MKPISSAISGALSRVQGASSSTGLQHGETGAVIDADKARAKLAMQTPRETDRNLLQWLESSLSVVAKPQTRMMFPTTGGYYAKVEGFDFTGLTTDNRRAARMAVEAAMTRPTVEKCEEWIASLHAVTARRGEDADTQGLALSLYAGAIARYPADIARQVCTEFAFRREKPNWFPSLSELDEACEKATNQRAKLLDSLVTPISPLSI